MRSKVFRYEFSTDVPMEEVESSLLLSLLGVQSLYGDADVQLNAAHYLDPQKRSCVIDADSDVGEDLNRLFIGFLRREFGADAFTVERIADHHPQPQEAAA